MNTQAYEKDLVVLLPSKDAQFLWSGVLARAVDMGLRTPSVQFDTHQLRDAGCLDADEFLESQTSRFERALVFVANRTRSGRPGRSREELESTIERNMERSGWEHRVKAIVVDPGIERWLLERELGGTWMPGAGDLQSMIDEALRRRRTPRSPEIYRALGARLVEEGGSDPAWRKMIATLKQWFGLEPTLSEQRGRASLQAQFAALVEQWLEETSHLSSMADVIQHPAYQQIIAMGPEVLPLILRDLEAEPKHWGPALRAITGARPVPREHAGKVKLVAEAWLRWAREHGYVW